MTPTRAVRKRIVDSPDRDVHAAIRNDRLTSIRDMLKRLKCARSGHSRKALKSICDALPRRSDVGMAHASPGSHGNLSQHTVAKVRGIEFAASRKGDDALRESFSLCLVVAGEAELAADFIKGN
jgi:hypothetical protein